MISRILWWKVASWAALPLFCLVLLIGLVTAVASKQASSCGNPAGGVVPVGLVQPIAPGAPIPVGMEVAGYSGGQLVVAQAYMQAAADHGLSGYAQTLGVAMSMGESGLTNVDHGDKVGPDSAGSAQQRDPWGPRADRLDAYKAATMFFTGGQDIDGPGRDGIEPGLDDTTGWEDNDPANARQASLAIHEVQNNADPYHYEKFWPKAQQVVAALGGALPPNATIAGQNPARQCPPAPAGSVPVGAGGWTNPAPEARFTSGFGTRWGTLHAGVDLAAPIGTPIYAAAGAVDANGNPTGGPATVISSGTASGFGWWIRLDHGNGYVTVYGHMGPNDLLVRVGDQVAGGQQISRINNMGESTGPHVHYELHLNGRKVDPAPFMAAHGVPLSAFLLVPFTAIPGSSRDRTNRPDRPDRRRPVGVRHRHRRGQRGADHRRGHRPAAQGR